MSGWLIILVLLGAAILGLRLLGLRGAMLQLCAAALCIGAAGYALQGRPGFDGSPRSGVTSTQVIPLTAARRAFFGEFTGSEHWLIMSESLARRGRTTDAVKILNSAVREHPNDPALWIGLGNALVDHSRTITPPAELAYRRAATLAPGHPAPGFFFGLALARSGDRDNAVAMWRQVLANAPAEASWRPLVEDAIAALSGSQPPR